MPHRIGLVLFIRFVLEVLLLLCVYSCTVYPTGATHTLRSAGPNRPELERVLEHYRSAGDAERYRAACFLVENMRGRYTGLAFD